MMKSPLCYSALLIMFVFLLHPSCSEAMPAVIASPVPWCLKAQLSVRLDDREGLYNGMSQGGTDLVVRNMGRVSCTLPALPELGFNDRHEVPLSVAPKISPAMHPGPVLLPISLGAGKEARITLRWVSSDVFEHGQCIRPAVIALVLPDGMLHLSFKRMMCTAAGQAGYFSQSLVTPDEN